MINFSKAALANIEETGADSTEDLNRLRAGLTREALLAECLNQADPDREEGWRDYVDALVAAEACRPRRDSTTYPKHDTATYPGRYIHPRDVDAVQGHPQGHYDVTVHTLTVGTQPPRAVCMTRCAGFGFADAVWRYLHMHHGLDAVSVSVTIHHDKTWCARVDLADGTTQRHTGKVKVSS